MSVPYDGGPAFPTDHSDSSEYSQVIGGMSMRQWYAGQALVGLATRMNAETFKKYHSGHAEGREAIVAFALADEMLAVERGELAT